MAEFINGRTLQTISGKKLTVLSKIGEGGQGIVYKVSMGNKKFAALVSKRIAMKSYRGLNPSEVRNRKIFSFESPEPAKIVLQILCGNASEMTHPTFQM